MLPETPRDRLTWAIKESFVIVGIFLFWVGVFLVVSIVLGILALPYHITGTRMFRPLVDLARRGGDLWAVVLPLTLITASLYMFTRVGELLIDHYSETLVDREDSV